MGGDKGVAPYLSSILERRVRFGSKADMCAAKSHVRFTPNSDIDCVWAISKHRLLPSERHKVAGIVAPTSGILLGTDEIGAVLSGDESGLDFCTAIISGQMNI